MDYFNELKQNFWTASTLAECSNVTTIREWAENVYNDIKDDVKAMAAFVTVLNHKC